MDGRNSHLKAFRNMRTNKHKTINGGQLVWWDVSADENFWAEHFSNQIEKQHAHISNGSIPAYLSKAMRHLPKHARILESGCGTGWLVAALIAQSFQAEGIDFSPSLVSMVQKRFPKLPIRIGDALAIDCPDNYYDGYLSFGVIEHRQLGCEPFVQEAYRVLRPGGKACIAVPYFNALRRLKAGLGLYASSPPPNAHFYQYAFTKRYFRGILEQHGFKLITFFTYGTQWCIPEELAIFRKIMSMKCFRKYKQHIKRLDILDSFQLLSHMLAAVVQKPAV